MVAVCTSEVQRQLVVEGVHLRQHRRWRLLQDLSVPLKGVASIGKPIGVSFRIWWTLSEHPIRRHRQVSWRRRLISTEPIANPDTSVSYSTHSTIPSFTISRSA